MEIVDEWTSKQKTTFLVVFVVYLLVTVIMP